MTERPKAMLLRERKLGLVLSLKRSALREWEPRDGVAGRNRPAQMGGRKTPALSAAEAREGATALPSLKTVCMAEKTLQTFGYTWLKRFKPRGRKTMSEAALTLGVVL